MVFGNRMARWEDGLAHLEKKRGSFEEMAWLIEQMAWLMVEIEWLIKELVRLIQELVSLLVLILLELYEILLFPASFSLFCLWFIFLGLPKDVKFIQYFERMILFDFKWFFT